MENDIYTTFNTIFSEGPKPPKSIFLEIILEDNKKTEVLDIFECLLNMYVYGFKKLNLSFNEDSMFVLKPYFLSIGIKINIELVQFDTALFNDPRYKYRYCSIENKLFLSNEEPETPFFVLNANQLPKSELNHFYATYQYEYEYLIFLSFEYI
jgi:hypothetical protein